MASITTWTRLEPRARGDDLAPSLEGRVYDAAWLLGRQWQLGEFVGEDTGSPVGVRLEVLASPLTAFRAAGSQAALDPATPIDALAGAEPRRAPNLAERAEAGAELLELLAEEGCSAEGIASFVGTRLMPAGAEGTAAAEGAALLALTAGRIPDGGVLAPELESIAATGRAPTIPGLSGNDAAAVVAAARAWVAWRGALVYAAPASAWVDERLEHHFALGVRPPGATAYALTAPAWNGDRLDWYDLDVDRRVAAPARPAGAPAPAPLPLVDAATGRVTAAGLPTPLAYPGMPAQRWWQFEDAQVSFAQVSAAPEDLARLLVVEFASVYGNDWYLWPLDLPVGAVHTVERLQVTNTFGEIVAVPAVPSSAGRSTTIDWQIFRPTEHKKTGTPGAYNGLLLLPTLASPLEGEPFEEVRFLRDELANLAWAVEAKVRGQDGLPLDRHGEAAAAGDLPASAPERRARDTDPLRYFFATDVPTFWFPLVPAAGGASTFHRLVMRRVDEGGQVRNVLPAGELLAPERFWLWQEEVPREGARVVRRHRMTRGADGRLYAWSARRAETGRGEGSSGLRYDDAVPLPEPEP